jgi:hypothetical protein
MTFKKYQHLEKFGNTEVQGIELGECYVFPKLDGTNASAWNKDGEMFAGSRNRELELEKDNAGFYNWLCEQKKHREFFAKYPNLRLYGEWLVPHTLKTYREDAWRRFYIFDVLNDETDQLLSSDVYKPLLEEFGLDYVPPLAKIKNGSYDNFIHVLNQNNFFIKDGEGVGEGIVIKNYDFYNKFGRQTWAKIVTSEFKEQHYKTMGCPETEGKMVEEEIVDEYCTEALIQKTHAKIAVDGWSSKQIPQLLETVYYDLIKEETYEFLKKFKNPTVNFRTLKAFVIQKIKTTMPEVF